MGLFPTRAKDGSTSSGSKKSGSTTQSILPVHTLGRDGPSAPAGASPCSQPGPKRPKARRKGASSVAFEQEATTDQSFVARLRGWACNAFHKGTRCPNYGTDCFNVDSSDSSSSHAGSSFSAQRRAEEAEAQSTWAVERTIVDWEDGGRTGRGSTSGGNRSSRPSSERGSVLSGHEGPSQLIRRTVRGVHFSKSSVLRHRARQAADLVWDFFDPRFEDPEDEDTFRRAAWQTNKKLAFWASLYLVWNWMFYEIFNRAHTNYEKWVFYLPFTLITIPVPLMVAFDAPFRFRRLWPPYLIVVTWYCAFAELIQTRVCGFYASPRNTCDGKDFLWLAFYSTALPTLILWVCGQRFWTALAMLAYFICEWVLVVPYSGDYVRNIISFFIYSCFIIYLHYAREMSERRIFKLAMQLKVAYRGQQRALAAESKANQAKRRFASYVFHEVRVPLNNAMLAYQTLDASNALAKDEDGSETIEAYALKSSLQQMAQILNDVLDFHRMDAGGFESTPLPFCLHRAVRSMMAGATVSASVKDLTFELDLDSSRDDVCIVGDEGRLRQLLANLGSNAVKFTPPGAGAITVKITWLGPARDLLGQVSGDDEEKPEEIIRFEVTDRGPGIKPTELEGGRLFQPYVQTKVGKLSGKGTGLGLAIVRQIVTLSGGRLGVNSRKDAGCTFWFELPYRLASGQETAEARRSQGEDQDEREAMRLQSTVSTTVEPTASAQDEENGDLANGDLEKAGFDFGRRCSIDPEKAALAKEAHKGPAGPKRQSTRSAETLSPSISSGRPTQAASATSNRSDPITITSDTGFFRVPRVNPTLSAPPSAPPSPPAVPTPQPNLQPPSSPPPAVPTQSPSQPVSPSPPAVPALHPPLQTAATSSTVGTSSTAAASSTAGGLSTVGEHSGAEEPEPKMRVLAIDDDPLTRTLMSRMFTKLGCDVHTANDGQQAIDSILSTADPSQCLVAGPSGRDRSPSYDLVCMDGNMPIKTGEEAVRELRDQGRTDYIVACTGNALLEDQASFREAGADHILTKPVKIKDLKAVLETAKARRTPVSSPTLNPTATTPGSTAQSPDPNAPQSPTTLDQGPGTAPNGRPDT